MFNRGDEWVISILTSKMKSRNDLKVGKSHLGACANGNKKFNMASYPSIRPTGVEGLHELRLPEGNYGIPDTMMYGFKHAQQGNAPVHPLERSEKHWTENKLHMDMAMLRNMQGIHAPLRLQMELKVARQMRRLPGLPSSSILEDSLTGRDELVDFDDILNVPEESEVTLQPHIQMEKRLNIL